MISPLCDRFRGGSYASGMAEKAVRVVSVVGTSFLSVSSRSPISKRSSNSTLPPLRVVVVMTSLSFSLVFGAARAHMACSSNWLFLILRWSSGRTTAVRSRRMR